MKNLLFLLSLFILNTSFGQNAQEYFERGFEKYNLGDYSGAMIDYNKAIYKDSTR